MKAKACSKAGFTLVEIMIVVAIIGLLATIAIPSYARARQATHQKVCINNLRQIDGAVQTWALENGKAATEHYQFDQIKGYLSLNYANNIPVCPASGTYLPGETVGHPPSCTFSNLGHLLQ